MQLHVAAIRFLFIKTLKRRYLRDDLPFTKTPRRLPTVLSQEEVAKLIASASSLGHRTILTVLYSTGMQLADLVAYILSWGWRLRGMTRQARAELAGYAAQLCQLRHRAVREVAGNPQFTIWSFAFITGLRPQTEREEDTGEETGEQ